MSKKDGEISPRQMRNRLGIGRNTAYRLCDLAISGGPSPLAGNVRRDVTGHYWIRREAVAYLADRQ